METRLKLLECHLFRKKFGYAALDTTQPWSTQWKVPLEVKKKEMEKKNLLLKLKIEHSCINGTTKTELKTHSFVIYKIL